MARRHRLIGKLARIVWRVTRPRTIGVRALLLDGTERIALVRHTYTERWYLPGGGVKRGEGTAAAILRELREEIGVERPVIERVLGVYYSRNEGKDDHVVIFVMRMAPGETMRAADPREIEEAAWFRLDRLPKGTSPATRRRVADYRAGRSGHGAW